MDDPLEWYGCYQNQAKWNKYLDSATNAHPAKGDMELFNRIFKHLEQLGLLHKEDKIIDFLSGTGRTAVLANLHGYSALTLELESHFIKMQEQNKHLLKRQLQREPEWEIIQGDARKLSTILKEKGIGIISPPYGLGEGIRHGGKITKLEIDKRIQPKYGDSKGKIGNLTDSNLTGIVSPPYGELGLEYAKNGIIEDSKYHKGKYQRPNMNGPNIGYVGITSPPYAKAEDGGGIFKKGYVANITHTNYDTVGNRTYSAKNHNFSNDNIGNLKDSSMVGITSPPYFQQGGEASPDDTTINKNGKVALRNNYGKRPEQLGAMSGGKVEELEGDYCHCDD